MAGGRIMLPARFRGITMKLLHHFSNRQMLNASILAFAIMWGIFFVLPSVLLGSQAQNTQNATASQPKRVLILNSYHSGMPFSDDEIRGIRTALPPDTEIFIEYMDTKRLIDADYLTLLKDVYVMKYAGKRFDLIFSLDDDALLFLLKHGQTIFKDIPVVFSGVNALKPGMLDAAPLFTGVTETMDIEATLNLGLKLFPQVRQILVITDRSTTGSREKVVTTPASKCMPAGGVRASLRRLRQLGAIICATPPASRSESSAQ